MQIMIAGDLTHNMFYSVAKESFFEENDFLKFAYLGSIYNYRSHPQENKCNIQFSDRQIEDFELKHDLTYLSNCEYIVLDCISCLNNIITNIEDQTSITESEYTISATTNSFKIINPTRVEKKNAICNFVKNLLALYPEEKIIIVKTFLNKYYLETEDTFCDEPVVNIYTDTELKQFQIKNDELHFVYECLNQYLPRAHYISVEDRLKISTDRNNPTSYCFEYISEVFKEISAITNTQIVIKKTYQVDLSQKIKLPIRNSPQSLFEIKRKIILTSDLSRKKELLDMYWSELKKNGSWIGFHTVFKNEPKFPHGILGIFISDNAKIGKNCVIFHQVTIGSNTIPGSKTEGSPTIGDNVYIGAGAKIIGNVKIGNNVRIGANCVVVVDIPSDSVVVLPSVKIIHKPDMDNRFYSGEGYWISTRFYDKPYE